MQPSQRASLSEPGKNELPVRLLQVAQLISRQEKYLPSPIYSLPQILVQKGQ